MPRNTAPAWDTAVSAEAAWFTAEPPASWPTAPPLISTSAGPFDAVQAYRPFVPPKGKNLFIYRDYGAEQGEEWLASGAQNQWHHHLIAQILWSFTEATGSGETMEQHLETAIAAVMARIRGPIGDKTHGGAFTDVGDAHGNGISRVRFVGDPYDSLEKQEAVEVLIHYTVTDTFTG